MTKRSEKTALVVEGGGMRGVFSAGVLHSFGARGFDPFDICIGVSAGACNLASHLAGQNDRNFHITTTYSSTSRFICAARFLRGGHYMDLDWLWDITISEYRLDLNHIFSRQQKDGREFIVVATSMETGKAIYIRPDASNLEHCLKVSSSLPVLYRNTLSVNNEKATDGGIADPIPMLEAYRRGARRITVIRSRPSSYVKTKSRLSPLFTVIFRKYPALAAAYRQRHIAYMKAVDFIHHPPNGVRIDEIAPPEHIGITRTTRNLAALGAAYRAGTDSGNAYIRNFR